MQMMITVEEAEQLIARHTPCYSTRLVPLCDAYGHVLKEPVVADRDQPPFNRVAMDGIALCSTRFNSGTRDFPVADVARAGEPKKWLTSTEDCLEVMTGAILPEGCDCVVRYEDVNVADGVATVALNAVTRMQNVHQQASDRAAGTPVLSVGTRLYSPHIAILASVGKADVVVERRPSVAVVSTGDELVAVDAPVAPHQIRQSNGYAIASAIANTGVQRVERRHVRDEVNALHRTLDELLMAHDIVILSGGVSMGKYDYVPEILTALGVTPVFHKVRQRPGKPFWFGIREPNKTVFALPGNPVSALVCCHRYVLPFLRRAAGDTSTIADFAVLRQTIDFAKPLTYFLPVQLSCDASGVHIAIPSPTHGSGDYGGLANTDGFVELPPEPDTFPSGTLAPVYRWSA